MIDAEVLQGGDKVEGPQPSKRVTAPGCCYGQEGVRDGVGMDGEWEY